MSSIPVPQSVIPPEVEEDVPTPGPLVPTLGGLLDLPALVYGAGALSGKYNTDDHLASAIPLRTVRLALRYGIRAIDTSVYYGPSEIVLGDALYALRDEFPRSSYKLMTKCGRYGDDLFDYSPSRIRESIKQSLARLKTDYLDTVYLHDVEFVATAVAPKTTGNHTSALAEDAAAYGLAPGDEAKVHGDGDQKVLDAFRTLQAMKEEGLIKYIGITGYPLATILRIAILIRNTAPFRPVDVLLSYSHLCLQNTTFLDFAPHLYERAGIAQLVAASPLSMALLTPRPPVWHPAPPDLQEAVVKARSTWDGDFPNLAVGYAVRQTALLTEQMKNRPVPLVTGFNGIILLDNHGRPIIQSGFRSTSPGYPLLHIDAVNDALAKATRPQDVDPVIYVSAYNIGDSPSACCHVPCADMRILCPISGNADPLFGFAFLQTFIEILNEYFGSLSTATIKDNFDVVYQLLEETLDAGGHPLTTSSNALRDIVLPPSLLNKLLNVAGANITTTINSGSGLGSGPFSSPIPWRKAGLKYTSNEIYFDMVEELNAIVNRNGGPVSSNVFGKIESNSRLSGTPDCLLSFTNPSVLVDCAFHPCVRLNRWTRGKTLSFVPPDGKFTLAEYRYSPAASTSTSTAVGKDTVPIPFTVKTLFDIEAQGGSFDVTLTSRLNTRNLENIVVELDLGEGAAGIKCTAARGTGGLGRGGINALDMGSGGNTGASWAFDSKKRVLRWEIASAPSASSWNLRGSFTTPSITPRPSHALQIRFEIQSYTFSSLKVEQLKITGEAYKPYKGVRGRAIGNVEWRW
ncbi:hypothetical protein D9619_001063 [Psilocybe cf. subviscida]|uniref:MHD domain-containing protein n=1 Tax=Psilocybe cf. subviscida TaxID=2480587 RepID=A0A8H5F3K5_9AGAR|nr:hypothetical protein D9619_001063 [Psilocybe cf. subviscida]